MGKKESFTNNNDNPTMFDFPKVPKNKIDTRNQLRISTIQHPKQTFQRPQAEIPSMEHENNNVENADTENKKKLRR